MPRVVLAEDHTLVRQSVMRTIGSLDDYEVVGEAESGNEVLALVERTDPDIVVLDIQLPGEDGLRLAEQIKDRNPETRILILSMHDDDVSLRRALDIGVDGFVSKGASLHELIEALHNIADGGSYLSSTVARRVINLAAGRSGPEPNLTDREHEILQLLAAGQRPSDIADDLYLSVKTVKNHLTNLYRKLEVRSAAQAVAAAYQRGLVTTTG